MAATTFTPDSIVSAARETVSFISTKLAEYPQLASPNFGIICGSGLGGLADSIAPTPRVAIEYADIPGFTASTVAGHAGKLVFGLLGEKQIPCVLMVGRAQFVSRGTIELGFMLIATL